MSGVPGQRKPREVYFFEKLGLPPGIGECWEWTGSIVGGYGMFWNGHRHVGAHRWAYEHFVGPIPDGLVIDHLCRNRRCVAIAHLEAVTFEENIRRGESPTVRAWRKNECLNGHAMTPENSINTISKWGKPQRQCRACVRARVNVWNKSEKQLQKKNEYNRAYSKRPEIHARNMERQRRRRLERRNQDGTNA